ncbi:acetylxylan esterase [Armatimonas sp.]|uniref:glucuronyl esterase domain-containing protein n=1 Tax=Armatimonas sp. TaxID=1872638 RepID=UPI00375266FC
MKTALFLLTLSALAAPAQPPRFGPSPEMQAKTQADHKHLLELLKIEKLRPGPSGTPSAPNAANSDEAKVGPYTLPDALTLKNGKKVASKKDWEARRQELFEDFDREMYGRTPKVTPKVTWEVAETLREKKGEIAVVTKKLVGHVDNKDFPSIKVDIQLTLTTPESATKPVPVVMEFGFIFPTRPGAPAFAPPPGSGPSWQEQVLAKGWGYAILSPNSIQADNGAGLREGIIGLVNKGEPRKVDDWGSLKAWAWGASRALDYFETDKAVDAKKVAIEGLSRYGKAALVTMAYEPRFSIGYIGSSGTGGAKLYRRIFGEQIENVASSGEYHWMAGNFVKYAGPLTTPDLPVDAHEIIALCAPRPVFISCGSPFVEGNWVDSKGQFLAGVAAGPVYTLLGKKPLPVSEQPAIGVGLLDSDIAYRQHEGGHTIGPNWPHLLTWAERYWK